MRGEVVGGEAFDIQENGPQQVKTGEGVQGGIRVAVRPPVFARLLELRVLPVPVADTLHAVSPGGRVQSRDYVGSPLSSHCRCSS